MSKTLRIIITIVGLIIITIGTVFWLRNPDSRILPIASAVVGLIVSFVPAVWPNPSSSAASHRMHRLARLIVRADRGIVGQAYLLNSDRYSRVLAKESNPETYMQYIGAQSVDGHSIYGAIFLDLEPEQQYTFWTTGTDPVHITIPPEKDYKIDLKIKQEMPHE